MASSANLQNDGTGQRKNQVISFISWRIPVKEEEEKTRKPVKITTSTK
jgi:hypothetical protein